MDVMTTEVVTADPETSVADLAKLLAQHQISAVPVVRDGRVVGLVSEGDLVHRVEIATERRRPWWRRIVTFNEGLAADFIKAHARRVGDVMTSPVISVDPLMPLAEVAMIMERNNVKRVPVLRDGELVGIISRANLVRALAASGDAVAPRSEKSDAIIRARLLTDLRTRQWADLKATTIIVHRGVVHIWGLVFSEAERTAIRIAAENTPGVRGVIDHRSVFPGVI